VKAILLATIALAGLGCLMSWAFDDRPLAVDCERARQRLVNMRECFQQLGCVVEEYDYTSVKRQIARCERATSTSSEVQP
jgi:hypothetical protein